MSLHLSSQQIWISWCRSQIFCIYSQIKNYRYLYTVPNTSWINCILIESCGYFKSAVGEGLPSIEEFINQSQVSLINFKESCWKFCILYYEVHSVQSYLLFRCSVCFTHIMLFPSSHSYIIEHFCSYHCCALVKVPLFSQVSSFSPSSC